jgi:hypothetical protein
VNPDEEVEKAPGDTAFVMRVLQDNRYFTEDSSSSSIWATAARYLPKQRFSEG